MYNNIDVTYFLYFTNFTRNSSDVLTEQVQKMKDKNKTSTLSLHALVEQAKLMKDCLIKGAIDDVKLGNLTSMLENIKPAVVMSKDFKGEKEHDGEKRGLETITEE